MANIEKYAEKFEVKNMTITMILSAMGFLVALTWRDAISKTIDAYLPAGESLVYTYAVALLVTILAAVVVYLLIKIREADIVPDKYEEALARQTVGRVKKLTKAETPFHIRRKLGLKKDEDN